MLSARPFLRVFLALIVFSVVTALVDIASLAELEGRLVVWSGIRKAISKTLNSGAVWAAVGVALGALAGRGQWLRGVGFALAGMVACLFMHDGLALVMGSVDGEFFLSSNGYWFAIAAATAVPLGLVGVATHQPGWSGWAARLVVPVGLLVAPWVTDLFLGRYGNTPDAVSSMVAGAALTGCAVWLLTLSDIPINPGRHAAGIARDHDQVRGPQVHLRREPVGAVGFAPA